MTHTLRLMPCADHLDSFAAQIDGLGAKLGVVLAQLPPSLAFEASSASGFFEGLRARVDGRSALACEPRHESWFSAAADLCLANLKVARVAADPPRAVEDGKPGGWHDLAYYRLHGAPRTYYSNYDADALARTRRSLDENCARGISTWCIFDNTAAFAALGNALAIGVVNP